MEVYKTSTDTDRLACAEEAAKVVTAKPEDVEKAAGTLQKFSNFQLSIN